MFVDHHLNLEMSFIYFLEAGNKLFVDSLDVGSESFGDHYWSLEELFDDCLKVSHVLSGVGKRVFVDSLVFRSESCVDSMKF